MRSGSNKNYCKRLYSNTKGQNRIVVLMAIVVIMILILAVLIILNTENDLDKIVGTWEDPGQYIQITFDDDGTGTTIIDPDSPVSGETPPVQDFQWQILEEDSLEITWQDGTSESFPYSISEDGNSLIIDGDELERISNTDDTDGGTDDTDDTDDTGDMRKIIKIELYTDKAPITTKNFIDLANAGKYDNVTFHRIIADFMIQGGDFTNGDGTGGHAAEYHNGLGNPNDEDSWMIPDEFHSDLKHDQYVISMANAGPNTGGSQFFIVTKEGGTDWLDNKHAVFGMVVDGMEYVDALGIAPTDSGDRPIDPATILNVTIETSGGNTYALMEVDY